jgi:galactose mutarotase-like enzyme
VRIEGLPDRCLDHHTMAEAPTAGVLAALPQGVDLLARPAGPVTLVDAAAGRRLQLQLSPPLDRAVVWSEPPRPMVCLEPWSGPRGALLSGDGRLELAGGASCELHCRYALSPAA